MSQTKFSTGKVRHDFVDENGDVFAFYRINPTDVKTAERIMECADFFENLKFPEQPEPAEIFELNRTIEEKTDYMLGAGAASSLFSDVSAINFDVDENGEVRLFAGVVFESLLENFGPIIEKRVSQLKKASRYSKKYRK